MEMETGYKAIDKDMKCKEFQFEVGVWYKHEGDLVCLPTAKQLEQGAGGFSYCPNPSETWLFYPVERDGVRRFKVDVKEVLISEYPGGLLRHVARYIRLGEEFFTDSQGNVGYDNTGNDNIGGYNSGDKNAGYWNSGNGNTGNSNTGNWNSGNGNIGDKNTGNRNAGHGNCGNDHIGSLCIDSQHGLFDLPAAKAIDFNLVHKLSELMVVDETIDPERFLGLPNATPERIQKLHDAHIEARVKKTAQHEAMKVVFNL